jgi:erythronate-4-phosphate dehydrogenase
MKIVADANIPFVKECFSSMGEVELVSGRELLAEDVGDADVLLTRSVTKVNEELLSGSSIKFVATATIGTEHIDVDYLNKRGIGFASAPGSNANSVAEYVVAGLLEVAAKHKIKLSGKSIGIVGVGNVGGKVEDKCRQLGMKVYLNDPPLERQTKDKKYLPLEKLFGCDVITLHTPLTFEGIDKTFHLADGKFFASLKDGCTFINTSRGGVVDTQAIKAAIKTRKVKAAILDVWEDEPNIDTELLEMADIGTSHIAGYSFDGKVAGMIMIYEAVCRHFGIEIKYGIESFLPESAVPVLEIDTKGNNEQEILRKAVAKIYDIKADDARLRDVLNMLVGRKCATFDQLRKEYPVRREFQNTQIVLRAGSSKLASKLAGIGFKVVDG